MPIKRIEPERIGSIPGAEAPEQSAIAHTSVLC